METNAIIGLVLIGAGFADAAVALFVLAPRIPDENRRRLVVGAVASGGVMMALAGIAIALGAISFG